MTSILRGGQWQRRTFGKCKLIIWQIRGALPFYLPPHNHQEFLWLKGQKRLRLVCVFVVARLRAHLGFKTMWDFLQKKLSYYSKRRMSVLDDQLFASFSFFLFSKRETCLHFKCARDKFVLSDTPSLASPVSPSMCIWPSLLFFQYCLLVHDLLMT